MTEPNENQGKDPGASGSEKAQPKVEVKDGAIFVDGKKTVFESDLIAAKKGLESQLEKAQTAHNEAIDTAKLELSSAQQQVANLTADLTKAKEASKAGAIPDAEVARIKTELADAKKLVETLQPDATKALELRRTLLSIQYDIPADSLANKTMKELDSFEEAAKALATSRGGSPGRYAVGGGGGQPHTMTPQERANKIISETPVRGTRVEATTK